jgi:signal transduction histidine kinase
LGLAIAQEIIRAHSGRIEVSSSPSGTTLTVTLPAANG